MSKLFKDLKQQTSDILDNAINIIYYMRGSISYFEYYEMTYIERQKISTFLDARFKEESKKPPQMNRVY